MNDINNSRITELVKKAILDWDDAYDCSEFRVSLGEFQRFAALVRNDALEEAKEVCRQVVRETSTTLTWEGCTEIQEALERGKT